MAHVAGSKRQLNFWSRFTCSFRCYRPPTDATGRRELDPIELQRREQKSALGFSVNPDYAEEVRSCLAPVQRLMQCERRC